MLINRKLINSRKCRKILICSLRLFRLRTLSAEKVFSKANLTLQTKILNLNHLFNGKTALLVMKKKPSLRILGSLSDPKSIILLNSNQF